MLVEIWLRNPSLMNWINKWKWKKNSVHNFYAISSRSRRANEQFLSLSLRQFFYSGVPSVQVAWSVICLQKNTVTFPKAMYLYLNRDNMYSELGKGVLAVPKLPSRLAKLHQFTGLSIPPWKLSNLTWRLGCKVPYLSLGGRVLPLRLSLLRWRPEGSAVEQGSDNSRPAN